MAWQLSKVNDGLEVLQLIKAEPGFKLKSVGSSHGFSSPYAVHTAFCRQLSYTPKSWLVSLGELSFDYIQLPWLQMGSGPHTTNRSFIGPAESKNKTQQKTTTKKTTEPVLKIRRFHICCPQEFPKAVLEQSRAPLFPWPPLLP